MRIVLAVLVAVLCGSTWSQAQFVMQRSGTDASLRGIHAVSAQVAWASGTKGTVLKTEDGGTTWVKCAVPAGAEALDFRGVQAWDAATAVIMSSGKGDLSRVYKTMDGCRSWKLALTNPDAPEGFFDAIQSQDSHHVMVAGDAVGGSFRIFESRDGGMNWTTAETQAALAEEGAFAASNQSLLALWGKGLFFFGTGSASGARLFTKCEPCSAPQREWVPRRMPMFPGGEGAGIFAIASSGRTYVAVGGDYKHPETPSLSAVSWDGGDRWSASVGATSGYRSSIAYDRVHKRWIAVGPNGTDVSTDDAKHWIPLQAGNDSAKNWNALSLPFVVGPKGRIGKLQDGVLQ